MPPRFFVSLPSKTLDLLRLWRSRHRRRNALADLSERDYLLADVGLTREDAIREAAKPFWRK